MTTIKFDTHITKAALTELITRAPEALMFGNNYAGVTYRPTAAGIAARADLLARVKDMRNRELTLSKSEAQLLRILVTAYRNNDGWTSTAITDRNLPVITALYNAGIRTSPQANTLPYYE